MRSSWLRFFCFASLSLAIGCGKHEASKPAQPLNPVAEPPDLVAELYVPKPNTTWAHARTMLAGPAMLLPSSYPALVTSLLGLPASAAEQIDLDVPTVGAITSDAKKTQPVLAIHVKDGGKLLSLLSQGPDATYLSRLDAPSGVTLLEPKPGRSSLTAALGTLGNYLLVSYGPDGLLEVGPFAARTLPTRPMSAEDAVVIAHHDALAGPIKTRLSAWWSDSKKSLQASDQAERERHGGSAPTFGDPAAALQKMDSTMSRIFTLLGDLSEARVSLTLDESGGHAKANLTPQSPQGPAAQELAAINPGDGKPLLDLPADISMALLMRDSAEGRARSAAEQADSIDKIFAGKLTSEDKQRVMDVLNAWSKGRGDWIALGGSLDATSKGLYGRLAVADSALLDKGARGLLELPKIPAFADPIKQWLGEIKVASTPTPLSGDPQGFVATVERKAPSAKLLSQERSKREPSKFELAWSFDKTQGVFAGAADGKRALQMIQNAESPKRLGDNPELKRYVDAVGNEISFALVVLPLRAMASFVGAPASTPTGQAPMMLAFGKSPSQGWFRLDAAAEALREVAKFKISHSP